MERVLKAETEGKNHTHAKSPENQNYAYLVRLKNKERILINKPVFNIGRGKNYTDYCVSDNRFVSRSHASILNKNGNFFLVDAYSLNNTYINNIKISSGVETLISHGEKIRMANEEFEFVRIDNYY